MVSFKSSVYVLIAIVIIIASGVTYKIISANPELIGESSNSNDNSIGNSEGDSDSNSGDDGSTSSSSSSGAGGGSSSSSSGGGGGSSSSGGPTCTTTNLDIAYSLGNFDWNFTCTSYDLGKCVALDAFCSLRLNNLDNSTPSGNFKIDYKLEDPLGNILGSQIVSHFVQYASSEEFRATYSISNSSGISESLVCNPKVLEIPKKQICN